MAEGSRVESVSNEFPDASAKPGCAVNRTEPLLAAVQREFPCFRLRRKNTSILCRTIDACLRILTLGKQSRFMTEYFTVLGETLYLAPCWDTMDDRQKYVLLCHERVHLRQRKRYGNFGITFLYLIPILPMGLAWGRARLEWEAYEETLRATAEVYGFDALVSSRLKENLIRRFTGPDYGFMWPFPNQVAKWYEDALDKIRTEANHQLDLDRKPEGHR
jgi:hypothetical protein